jgi:putative tryptophan/tyrosine transport system substrate-binding protein
MRRREFITLLGGATMAWPLAARAQHPAMPPTIGFMGGTTASDESQRVAAFLQQLRQLGWIENRNITIEYRWADGRPERAAEIAAEFVRLKVNVRTRDCRRSTITRSSSQRGADVLWPELP